MLRVSTPEPGKAGRGRGGVSSDYAIALTTQRLHESIGSRSDAPEKSRILGFRVIHTVTGPAWIKRLDEGVISANVLQMSCSTLTCVSICRRDSSSTMREAFTARSRGITPGANSPRAIIAATIAR